MEDSSSKLKAKLGLKPDQKTYTLHAPSGYEKVLKEPIPLVNMSELPQTYDWLQVFYHDEALLKKEINTVIQNLSKDGQLWVSWPKKSSSLKSDLSDTVIRRAGLETGLVDVKVVAIDETWSGLKFVHHLVNR